MCERVYMYMQYTWLTIYTCILLYIRSWHTHVVTYMYAVPLRHSAIRPNKGHGTPGLGLLLQRRSEVAVAEVVLESSKPKGFNFSRFARVATSTHLVSFSFFIFFFFFFFCFFCCCCCCCCFCCCCCCRCLLLLLHMCIDNHKHKGISFWNTDTHTHIQVCGAISSSSWIRNDNSAICCSL